MVGVVGWCVGGGARSSLHFTSEGWKAGTQGVWERERKGAEAVGSLGGEAGGHPRSVKRRCRLISPLQ